MVEPYRYNMIAKIVNEGTKERLNIKGIKVSDEDLKEICELIIEKLIKEEISVSNNDFVEQHSFKLIPLPTDIPTLTKIIKLQEEQIKNETNEALLRVKIEELKGLREKLQLAYDDMEILKSFKNQVINQEQFNKLQESKCVKLIDYIGDKSELIGVTWYDITFIDGDSMDVYVFDFYTRKYKGRQPNKQ